MGRKEIPNVFPTFLDPCICVCTSRFENGPRNRAHRVLSKRSKTRQNGRPLWPFLSDFQDFRAKVMANYRGFLTVLTKMLKIVKNGDFLDFLDFWSATPLKTPAKRVGQNP